MPSNIEHGEQSDEYVISRSWLKRMAAALLRGPVVLFAWVRSELCRAAGFLRQLMFARMSVWLWVTIALGAVIGSISPSQISVGVSKVLMITTGAWLGYWLDRTVFPNQYPWKYDPENPESATNWSRNDADPTAYGIQYGVFVAVMLRRTMIIGAAMLAIAIGV